MAIYPDKKGSKYTGRWRVEVQYQGRRLRGRYDTKAEAEQAETVFLARLKSGEGKARVEYPEGPKTIHEALGEAGERLWGGQVSQEETLARMRNIAKIIGPKFLWEIETTDVDRVIKALRASGRKGATINRHLSALHKLLSWCLKRKYITEMPTFDWQAEAEPQRRALTEAEARTLIGLLEGYGADDVADFCRVALATGMRRGELLSLRPEDLQGTWAHLRASQTKTKVARSVPLSPEVEQILHKRLPWSLTPRKVRWFWDRARKDMGLSLDRHFVVHAMRHTACTRLVNEHAVPTMIAKKYLGHKRVTTTERYAHVHEESLMRAAQSLATGVFRGIQRQQDAHPVTEGVRAETTGER